MKDEIIRGLLELYNDNSLKEKDEVIILDTLTYLGYDIRLI